MDLSDKEYVERSRDGYPDDFQALVQRYQKPLFVYLAARLGDPLQAEEAAQETFVRAFLGLQKLRKPESCACSRNNSGCKRAGIETWKPPRHCCPRLRRRK